MTVVLAVPNLFPNDAVGNDVLAQKTILETAGIEVKVFSETFDPEFASMVISKTELESLIAKSETVLVYHHSILWDWIEGLIQRCRCRVFLRYHNITPPEFFKPYNKQFFDVTSMGRAQTERLVQSGKIECYLGDSHFNNLDLIKAGAKPESLRVVSPLHRVADFEQAAFNQNLAREMIGDKLNLLFVGRLAPNKGHWHIIETVRSFRELYGDDIRAYFVGGSDPRLTGYGDDLQKLIKSYGLKDYISFRSKVSFDDLHTFYLCSQIFLVMSEHEGFCVPVLEAQYHQVPVIALNRGAVPEALGPGQLCLKDPDYDLFAGAIAVAVKNENRLQLIDQGLKNYQEHSNACLGKAFLESLGVKS